MSRVVSSPVGEQIEVLDRSELGARLGVEGPAALSQVLKLSNARWSILEGLWLGGQVTDRPSGRALAKLAERTGANPRELSLTFAAPVMALCVERQMNIKRTYSLRLRALPEPWLARLRMANTDGTATPQPLAQLPANEPEPKPPEPEPIEVELEPMGLLAEAIRLIAQAMPGLVTTASDPNPEVLDRLATTLEDNERLRRKLQDLGDRLSAVEYERNGLRQAKRALEANLTNMAKGAFNEVTYRRFVDLDRMIRETPRSAKDAS